MRTEIYSCDICGSKYPLADQVPGAISFDDGKDTFIYGQVCEMCLNKILVYIENYLLNKNGEHPRNL